MEDKNKDNFDANRFQSDEFCGYCTGKIKKGQCDSCDALTGDCFKGRVVSLESESNKKIRWSVEVYKNLESIIIELKAFTVKKIGETSVVADGVKIDFQNEIYSIIMH